MCFSAPASFIASGTLAVIGFASFTIAKKEDRILAIVPLFFAVQQALEGVQWLHLDTSSSSLVAGYGYLFFAYMLWPIYVPILIFILEKDKKRRKLLKLFIFLGIIVALFFLGLFLTHPLYISKLRACISYDLNIPLKTWVSLAYLASIFGPFFLSSRKYFKWFGIIIAISALISWVFFTTAFASVWCFFSAAISSIFFLYIRHQKIHNPNL